MKNVVADTNTKAVHSNNNVDVETTTTPDIGISDDKSSINLNKTIVDATHEKPLLNESSPISNIASNDKTIDNQMKNNSNSETAIEDVNDSNENELFSKTFIILYEMGVQSYLENNWDDCITFLELAQHEFKVYQQGTVNCRLQCWFESERATPFFETKIEWLNFYDLILKRTVCLNTCKNKVLKEKYLPPFQLPYFYRQKFLNKNIYEYLQLCYYRVSDLLWNSYAFFFL